MTHDFDAKASAHTVETFAKAEIDGRIMETDPLAGYLTSFTPAELRAISAQLKSDNHLPNTYPKCELRLAQDGTAQSLTIKPSIFDSQAQSVLAVVGLGRDQQK